MSTKKTVKVVQREKNPTINVCDTTTTLPVTSENVSPHELARRQIANTINGVNFRLTDSNLQESTSDFTKRLQYTASRSNDVPTRSIDGCVNSRENLHQIQQKLYNNEYYQRYNNESHSVSASRDQAKNPRSDSRYRRVTGQLSFQDTVNSRHESMDSSTDDEGEPDLKMKRCQNSGSNVFDGTKGMSDEDRDTYDMIGPRSKVPEEIRLKINSRERQRMHDLNSALDSLRQVMPYSSGPAVKKLSKMSTLLLARNYIVMLTKCVEDMKRLVQELSTNQRLPIPLHLPSLIHETPTKPPPLLPTNTSGLHIPTPFLHPAAALHCMTSSTCTTCSCFQCLKKRQTASDVTALMGWKPG